MPVNWEGLEPAAVERAVAALLLELFEGSQRVDGSGGDDGADVVLSVPGGIRVFEIKSFTGRLTASRRRQVESSLRQAVSKRPDLRAWTLVVPIELTPGEQQWFGTLADLAPGVVLDWLGRTRLESEFSRRPHLERAHLPTGAETRALGVLAQFNQEQAALGTVLDVAPRVDALRRLSDDTDEYFRVEQISTRESGTELTLVPRRPLSGPPVRGIAFRAPAGSPEARAPAKSRFMRSGRG